ncbi:MAG: glycosyltransferase [Muribaculaceae bacterium]|nr:glycosyltransferase [Muribaculaceae bacterium]
MRVLHTIASMGAKSGGTTTATFDLLSALNKPDIRGNDRIDLLSLSVSGSRGNHCVAAGCEWYREVPDDGKTPYHYSRNLRRFLATEEYDVYHANGMWLDDTHATCHTARKKGKPYVITPHGMLYPEALKRSAWKKWPLRKLFFDKDILEASCIHATCETEMRHLRSFGYTGPIAVIGNPVVSPAIASELIRNRSYSNHNEPKRFGFLGRLHPIKRIENLIRAVALRKEVRSELLIMGSGDADNEAFLRDEAQRLGVRSRVRFLGFVSGDAKFERLALLDALFVPSDMENFGMIIPEALLVGTPVMASLGTPWESLNKENCGWWTSNSPESIAAVSDSIAASTPDELRNMGLRGRHLVLDRFESSKVAASMHQLYKWLNVEYPKPEFICHD